MKPILSAHDDQVLPAYSEHDVGAEQSFDELARGLAAGTISRRRAIKLAGGTLLGAALIPFLSSPAEARRRNVCRRKATTCERSTTGPRCGGNDLCRCARITSGSKVCANFNIPCPTRDECDRNSDCGRNEVCAVVSACCGGNQRNACVRRCG